MGNKYMDEHLNTDSLSGLGELHSVEVGNKNPKIEIVGAAIDNIGAGIAIGLAIGVALSRRQGCTRDDSEDKDQSSDNKE